MTYEYVCTACNHAWEAEQSISAQPLKKCPSCGKNTAKRQVSGGTGFLLKGGGWYADGYGSSSPKSTGSKADSSKETKPTSDSKGSDSSAGTKDSGSKEKTKASSASQSD